MLYSEYLRCAEKHLKSCKAFLESYQSDANKDFEVFLELFYITGYVMEGLTVYSAYKIYGWPSNIEIDDRNYYDPAFVRRTNLDYFHYRFCDTNGRVVLLPNGKPQSFPNRGLKVQSHGFQQIAMQLLANQGPFVNDNSTPYYGNGPLDSDVRLLIDLWKPEVRYYYRGHSGIAMLPTLNKELISRLVDTCSLVFSQTISLVGI